MKRIVRQPWLERGGSLAVRPFAFLPPYCPTGPSGCGRISTRETTAFNGRRVSPGIYLYRMDAGRQRKEGKIVVVR